MCEGNLVRLKYGDNKVAFPEVIRGECKINVS